MSPSSNHVWFIVFPKGMNENSSVFWKIKCEMDLPAVAALLHFLATENIATKYNCPQF
jgi:hypothetical protein